jgi:tetratricopeptide (TPR) repeat protein
MHKKKNEKTLLTYEIGNPNAELKTFDINDKTFHSVEISLKEKEIGNEYYKKKDYNMALKHYKDAILRNPSDPKLYSNMASSFVGLNDLSSSIYNIDKAISLDEKNFKFLFKKCQILYNFKNMMIVKTLLIIVWNFSQITKI